LLIIGILVVVLVLLVVGDVFVVLVEVLVVLLVEIVVLQVVVVHVVLLRIVVHIDVVFVLVLVLVGLGVREMVHRARAVLGPRLITEQSHCEAPVRGACPARRCNRMRRVLSVCPAGL